MARNYRTSRKNSRKYSRKYSRRRLCRRHRGGSTVQPAPYESYGFSNGARNPRENARLHGSSADATQMSLNNMAGGFSTPAAYNAVTVQPTTVTAPSAVTASPGTATVPQFPSSGSPAGGTVTGNTSAVTNTVTGTQNTANAANDCYATGSCPGQRGGKKRRRRYNTSTRRSRK